MNHKHLKGKQVIDNKLDFKLLIISFFSLFLIILFTFRELYATFYQQDEWLGVGLIYSQGWSHVWLGFSQLQVLFGESRLLVRILGVIFFNQEIFSTNYVITYILLLHFLNSLLVFLITQKLAGKILFSLIASIFFAINSVHSQSVTWIGGAFGLMPASFFILLSIYFAISYETKKIRAHLYFSFLFAIISIYFKENGLFLFLFIPFLSLIYHNSFTLKMIKNMFNFKNFRNKLMSIYSIFLLYITVFVFYRLITQFGILSQDHITAPIKVISENTQNLPLLMLVNAIIYPLSTLSLIFTPPGAALAFTTEFTKLYFPFLSNLPNLDLLIQTVLLLSIAIFFSFFIVGLLIIIYKRYPELQLLIKFATLLFIVSILPYIVIIKGYAYLEPRYYYITSVAAGIFLATFGYLLQKLIPYFKLGLITSLLMLAAFLSYHISVIQEDIRELTVISSERKAVITQLKQIHPELKTNKNIFYITGNTEYLMPKNYLPFQQGLGYTLMVLYYKGGQIPQDFLSEPFLWDMGSEGYRERNGKGFGYVTSIDDLKEISKNNNLSQENVIALYYDGNSKKLKDITKTIQLK